MNPESVQLLVTVLVVVTICSNIAVWVYGKRALYRAGDLLATRPIAKGMMKSELRQLAWTTLAAMVVTCTSTIRNYWMSQTVGEVPVGVFLLIVFGYMAFYAIVLTPAVTVFEQARVLMRACHREGKT